MRVCPQCGYVEPVRSGDISGRFHAHVTYVTRALHGQRCREEVYTRALLRACEVEPPEGAAPYPYTIVDDVLYPGPTREATNKEMMTACFAIETLAVEWDVAPLPERYEDYDAL